MPARWSKLAEPQTGSAFGAGVEGQRMDARHRHLTDRTSLSLMALDDVLDRGSPADWSDLVAVLRADPFGSIARKVLHLCRAHEMYGTSKLWPAIIERLRRDAAP